MNVFTLKIRVFTRKCDIFPPKYGVSCDKIPTFSNTVCNKILTLPSLVTPSLVTLHPLFQRERRIIWMHTEAVDHLARYRLCFFLMSTLPHRCSSLCTEPVYQLLICRFMDMSVQHISQRRSIRPTSELAVIAENRIVHQHDFTLIVMDFRIVLDPHKPWSVKILVL